MKHKEWKRFLVRRFLMILILVSISQWLLNRFFDNALFPFLSDLLQVDFFMSGLENGLNIGILLRGGLYLAVTGICSYFPEVIGGGLRAVSERWAGSVMTERISRQMLHLSPRQTQIYIWGMVAIIILIVLALLVPYIVAAFVFSRMVEAQVQRMEAQERQQKTEYDRRKNLLLSDVAHDLKTPMTTVAGYARALLPEGQEGDNGIPEEKRQEFLETIYNKSMQMSELLNLLFEYVKLDSEGVQLRKERKDLWELLRDCGAGLYMDFEAKKIEMIPQIPEEKCEMDVDGVQFQRVINNLLNNALKHNPPGTRVWIMAEHEDENMIIRICDDGAVIPEKTANDIFEPFVLGNESRSGGEGSGLGLSIAHKIVAMHGGILTLEQNQDEEYTKAFVIRFVA
ncbi:MAG: hypothetical protein HFI70_06685 [Lachnospiraceae bacterium]|nr:hypothetical protein [Lachnospiraceae bacterium]